MLATCLRAWVRGGDEDERDGDAAAFVVAETVLLLRGTLLALRKKKG